MRYGPLGGLTHEERLLANYRAGQLPESELAAKEVLSLPVYPEMTAAMREEVASAILGFFGKS